MIRPMGDKVLCRAARPKGDQTVGGIILLESSSSESSVFWHIITAVGPSVRNVALLPGVCVVLPKYHTTIMVDGREHALVREEEILGVLLDDEAEGVVKCQQ